MIHVAVVDNEVSAQQHLQALLARYSQETNTPIQVAAYDSGILFLDRYRSEHYDLVLMDVDMPEMDGFETAAHLREIDPTVVLMFVTNVARHAIRGYEVGALDYIVKPLSYEAFYLKLPTALSQCKRNMTRKVIIRTRSGQNVLDTASVIYVESNGHHITWHTEQGDHPSYSTMKEVETLLDSEGFFRCNSGYIVNLAQVAGFEGSILPMAGGAQVEISRARKKEFLNALQRYYFKGGR